MVSPQNGVTRGRLPPPPRDATEVQTLNWAFFSQFTRYNSMEEAWRMFHLRRHFEIKPKKIPVTLSPNLNPNPSPNPKPNLNPNPNL